MRILLLLVIAALPTVCFAQIKAEGTLHATIGADGSITYHLITAPNNAQASTGTKALVASLVGTGETPPKAFELIDPKNDLAGYFLAPASERVEPLETAIDEGYTVKAVTLTKVPEDLTQVYKFVDPQGQIGGAWLPANDNGGTAALGNLIPTDWSTSKVGAGGFLAFSMDQVKLPEEEVIGALRENMFNQAVSMACKSKVMPRQVSVTISVGASAGLIVAGEGSISFNVTWDSAELCPNRQ